MTVDQKDESIASEEEQEKNKEIADQEVETEENENIATEQETSQENTDKETEETIEELQSEIKRMKEEYEKTYERMLRIQAEYENFKKRTQREKISDRKYRSQDLANELLPALDNFERALAIEATEETKSIIEGISMVYRQIKDAFKAEGIEEIECVGKEFDPNLHHAVMQVEDENKESNIIVEELQKGYILNDRVIRPAMVKVNK